jgi:hypothetical protein
MQHTALKPCKLVSDRQCCAVLCRAVAPNRQAKKMDQPGNLRNIKKEGKEAIGRAKEAARNGNPDIKVSCAAGCLQDVRVAPAQSCTSRSPRCAGTSTEAL